LTPRAPQHGATLIAECPNFTNIMPIIKIDENRRVTGHALQQ